MTYYYEHVRVAVRRNSLFPPKEMRFRLPKNPSLVGMVVGAREPSSCHPAFSGSQHSPAAMYMDRTWVACSEAEPA